MLELKMDYLGLDVNIVCKPGDDLTVNSRTLLTNIEKLLDMISLYPHVNITIKTDRLEEEYTREYDDDVVVGMGTVSVKYDNMGET